VEVGGEFVPNPFVKWTEVDPSLPSFDIRVMGLPTNSPSVDAFIGRIMEAGCKAFPKITALGEAQRFQVCHTMRSDGAFVQGGRNEDYMLNWLRNHPEGFAIASYSFFGEKSDIIAANSIDGVFPTLEEIAGGAYPLSRPIYLYVKTKHVDDVKGLQKFLYEFTSEHAIGPEGYLVEKGLIPLDDRGRNHARDLALSLATISR
jgi:phosphate transport system substrate-binding protein